jgi:hypothetical protein
MDNTIGIDEIVERIEKAFPDFMTVCGKMGEGVREADHIGVMLRSPLRGELPARSYSFHHIECYRAEGAEYKVCYIGEKTRRNVDSGTLAKLLGLAGTDGFTIELVNLTKRAVRKDGDSRWARKIRSSMWCMCGRSSMSRTPRSSWRAASGRKPPSR